MSPEDEAAHRRIEWLKFRLAYSRDLFHATAAFEHAALKPPFILNGGGVIAFLALMGSFGKEEASWSGISDGWAVAALSLWIVGLVSSGLAAGVGYYSQFAFRRSIDPRLLAERHSEEGLEEEATRQRILAGTQGRRGQLLRTVATALAGSGYLAFFAGVGSAMTAIF